MAGFKRTFLDILIVVIIPGLLFFMYTKWSNSSAAEVDQALTEQLNTAAANPNEIKMQTALELVRTTNFDQQVFSDPVFTSLHDFTTPTPTTAVGRTNPFLTTDELRALKAKKEAQTITGKK